MPAASVAVRPVLTGPTRKGSVLAVTGRALFLDVDGDVLALLAPGAVRLPVGVLVGEAQFAVAARLAPGAPVRVGAGGLHLAGLDLRVVRWCESRVPAVPGLRAAGARFAVRDLVGLGPGLTPAGDDLLCGALAALAACGPPASGLRAVLAEQVLAAAHRTTALSAALLRQAVAGHAVPELIDVLRAIPRGGPDLAVALAAVHRVGHSSGPALARGARLAVAA